MPLAAKSAAVVTLALLGALAPGPAATQALFHPHGTYPAGLNARDLAIGDFGGDGVLDVAVIVSFTGQNGLAPSIRVFPGERAAGRPTGRLGPAVVFPLEDPNLGPSLVAGPFVGEAPVDVAFASSINTQFFPQHLNTIPGTPHGQLAPGLRRRTLIQSVLIHGIVTGLAAADLDGDGILDLVAGHAGPNARVQPALGEASLGRPTGTFAPQARLAAESAVSGVVCADFDSDGRMDIAAALPAFDRVDLHRGLGDGRFDPAGHVTTESGPRGLVAVDLDRDGLPDLVAANSRSGTVSVALARRGGPADGPSFGLAASFGTGARSSALPLSDGSHGVVTADWNLDGLADLAVLNERDLTVGILLGRGDGGFETPVLISIGHQPEALASADLDADGAPDLLVLSRLDGVLRVFRNARGNRVPDCGDARAVVPDVWPPNGALMPVTIVGVTDPDGDPVTVHAIAVTQDEPVGRGGRCPDAVISDGIASVRGEREGSGDGRVYVVHFEALDDRGGRCEGSVSVCVPHDRGSADDCVDSGQAYVSTGPCGVAATREPEMELAVVANGPSGVQFAMAWPAGVPAELVVFDVGGRRIARMAPAGTAWCDLRGARSGLYFAELRAGGARRVVRFVLAR